MEMKPPAEGMERKSTESRVREFCWRWMQQGLGVLVAGSIVPGLKWEEFTDLALAALMLATLHAFLRPLLFFLSLPLLVVTLGLFMIVINAGLLMLVSRFLQPRFEVDSFGAACWGAIVIGCVGMFVKVLRWPWKTRVRFHQGLPRNPRQTGRPTRDSDGPGSGPIIDV
ncbi:MAG: phage holin family protein [Verrucomicrobia bacterium]|nr:phage holin family protein [Verrucomicrobiota bacterium]